MNILAYVPQMAAYGGMENHVCSLASALSSRGHIVTLVTTSNSLGEVLRRDLGESGVALVELQAARGAVSKWRKLIWICATVWRMRHTNWDVVYTNGQSALAKYVWRAAPRGCRVVHHHHTAADAGERTTWSGGYLQVLARAQKLVGCSVATCRELSVASGRSDVTFLPYLTNDPFAKKPVVDTIRPRGEILRFGFVGRLIREKGIERILSLSKLSGLEDIVWHIHGEGADYPPEYFAGNSRVAYFGRYGGAGELAAILEGLDGVVLFSTHNEGMPLALLEAMAGGVPWLATDRGGTRELAAAAEYSYVVPADISDDALANAVYALADRIRRNETSRVRQRACYEQKFSPASVLEQWEEFFTAGNSN